MPGTTHRFICSNNAYLLQMILFELLDPLTVLAVCLTHRKSYGSPYIGNSVADAAWHQYHRIINHTVDMISVSDTSRLCILIKKYQNIIFLLCLSDSVIMMVSKI